MQFNYDNYNKTYPTKLVSAHVMCQFGYFGAIASEVRHDCTEEKAKATLASEFAYKLKSDPSQRLFKSMTEEEVRAELMSENYAWRIFENNF